MPLEGANEQITEIVLSWEGVTARPHSAGRTDYRLGNLEIGHIHRDEVVDVPFPKKLAAQLIASGRAEPNERDPGVVSCPLVDAAAVEQAIVLLRESFERLAKPKALRLLRELFQGR